MRGSVLTFNPVLISAVYFSASIHHDQHNLPAGRTLVFDNVVANKGGGYITNNGVFTAPISGAYVFSWTIVTLQGNYINVILMHNGERKGLVQAGGTAKKQSGSGSNTIILDLNVGDNVHLEVNEWGEASTRMVHGSLHSTFSGWLL